MTLENSHLDVGQQILWSKTKLTVFLHF